MASSVNKSNSSITALTLTWVQDTQPPTYCDSYNMIHYSAYCQACDSQTRYPTGHQCDRRNSTTYTCAVTFENLHPDKCYECCVSVLSAPIFKLGEHCNRQCPREDNNGKQWHDFAYSHFYERLHIYLQDRQLNQEDKQQLIQTQVCFCKMHTYMTQ